MKKSINQIEQEATDTVSTLIGNFGRQIKEGTSSADTFLTLDSIEQKWSELRRDTDRVYSDMVSELIASIDERELISKKKESGASEE